MPLIAVGTGVHADFEATYQHASSRSIVDIGPSGGRLPLERWRPHPRASGHCSCSRAGKSPRLAGGGLSLRGLLSPTCPGIVANDSVTVQSLL